MNPTLQILIGLWRAVLVLPDAELPFNFELVEKNNKYSIIIMNGDERIQTTEAELVGDSLFTQLPVFDSEFRIRVYENTMDGSWVNYSRKGAPSIPFHATFGDKERFKFKKPPAMNVSGRWETWFEAGTPDSSLAIGVFRQNEANVTGTFLTAGGDHRFLQGAVTGNVMWLSTFDGSHCWLYKAEITGNEMKGTFWSGLNYKSFWQAKRNDEIELPNPFSITSVNQPLNFSFPDLDSNIVSLKDDQFKNKAIIIQILGSWCPNCLDETEFLSNYYSENKSRGVEVIGLAFEKTADFQRASGNIKRLQKRFNVKYPLLIAGVVGKEEVMKKIQGVQNFSSYPTTIYINRKGIVEKVYSGFYGPATGEEYEKYKIEFEETVNKLLAE